MSNGQYGGASRSDEFRDASSTLDMESGQDGGEYTSSGTVTQSGARRVRLIDSDDDMEDDDDDELLTMPTGSQRLDLQIDDSFSHQIDPSLVHHSVAVSGLPERIPPKPLATTTSTTALVQEEEDDLFGDDFLAQFGNEDELEFESSKHKLPVFARRIPLLESTNNDEHIEGEDGLLGLDRLSISQKHRTISGAPTTTGTTKSTHAVGSSTTIMSALPSRFDSYSRNYAGPSSFMSQNSSLPEEEELLEMMARQQDTMLDDLILEDEQLRGEEEGLHELIALQQEEQEQQMFEESSKRKLPDRPTAIPNITAVDEDRYLQEDLALEEVLQRSTETVKKTRLGTGANGAPTPFKRATPRAFTGRQPVPEMPKHDYSIPPTTGPFLKGRDSNGRAFYLAKKVRIDYAKSSIIQRLQSNGESKPLLTVPIHRMMDELDAEIRIQKQEAINRLDHMLDDDDLEIRGGVAKEECLWVDKYRPKTYTDLMGDERVNREVLSWIKEWDQCVFGRKFKKFVPEYKKDFQDFRKPDAFGRPERKILLLTGPPGLGKTTMAHVIARQAGYNVVEVNASDDRTGAAIKGKIEAALEIQSILGSDKPNLLVIDEIDGVSSSGGEQSFIKLLVDIATVETGSGEEKKAGGGKKKKFAKKPLMRPIICICNDQYAPVLRPLRTIAQIYQFRKPSVRAVVTRLQQICEIEQVPSDTRAFGVLFEMTEGDMRSCLNTLQFIKNRSKTHVLLSQSTNSRTNGPSGNSSGEGLTLDALGKATIGRKDQNKSLFSVWEELFQAPYARKNRSALKVLEEGRDGLVRDDNNTYVSRMVNLIHTNGDYDKLIQGCFENYPTMTFHDVAMAKVVELGEWLAFYDQLNAKVSTNFEYEVGGYIAYAITSFHRFFAGSVRQKIEYPRKDYESFVAHKANDSILQGMAQNLPAKVQRHFQKSNFATELLSPFLRILSPFLRPVNKQLIKPEERLVLKRLVDIMIHFQLTFVQEKTEDGQYVYRLEPSIEKLGDFSTIGLKNVLTNRYAVRQLIAQEIEVEVVRRTEAAKEARMNGGIPSGKGKGSSLESSSLSMDMDKSAEKEKDLDLEREAVDFFGRVIVQSGGSLSVGGSAGETMVKRAKKTRIWYKFNEGTSNAVKAKVFISELL